MQLATEIEHPHAAHAHDERQAEVTTKTAACGANRVTARKWTYAMPFPNSTRLALHLADLHRFLGELSTMLVNLVDQR